MKSPIKEKGLFIAVMSDSYLEKIYQIIVRFYQDYLIMSQPM